MAQTFSRRSCLTCAGGSWPCRTRSGGAQEPACGRLVSRIVGFGAIWLGTRLARRPAPVLHNKTFLSAAMNDVSGAAVPLMAVWLPGLRALRICSASAYWWTLRALLYLRLLPWWRATTRDATQPAPSSPQERRAFCVLSGVTLIASRIDLYCVACSYQTEKVAHYQVMMNLLLTCASLGGVVILPFSRDLPTRGHGVHLGVADRVDQQ